MLTTALALIATTLAAGAAPAAASPTTARASVGAITAAYDADRNLYCLRSGWGSVTSHTGRPARAGECRTANEWRRRGIAFAPVAPVRTAGNAQIAAR